MTLNTSIKNTLPPLLLLAMSAALLGLGYSALYTTWLQLPTQWLAWMPATALALALLAVAASLVLVVRRQRRVARTLATVRAQQQHLLAVVSQLGDQHYAEAAAQAATLQGPLGSALGSLAHQQQAARVAEEMRAWHAEGMARMNDVLRSHSQLQPLATALMQDLCKYLKADQGVLFLVDNADTDLLQVMGSYVSSQVAGLQQELNTGGLVEQVRRDHQTLHLKDVPTDYVRISSGLGQAQAAELLLVPIVFEQKLLGVLELATLHPIAPQQVKLAQELADKSAATFFNLMSADSTARMLEESRQQAYKLQEADAQMRALNEGLETKVEERTAELQHILEELQSTQHRMVQSEKLASLGQLIAGVAHEINTPLAAIKASVENMADFLPQTLNTLPMLMAEMDEQTRGCFQLVVEKAMQNRDELNTREERRLRKELETELESMGLGTGRDLARSLLGAGVHGDLHLLSPLLQHPRAEEILRTAYHLAQLRNNMNIIGHAADKTRKTVYALKSYSHFQQEDAMAPMDLNESMDVVLTLYHNQLKHGVQVTATLDRSIPTMMGYSDELGQVWTNIIHNAAQAMQYEGKLDIETLYQDGHALVRITDSGPGIPAEVLPRIFDPFFTTKPQGEGTGLGLDICKKIVEKHNGTLEVETEPGRTSFLVTLPINSPTDSN